MNCNRDMAKLVVGLVWMVSVPVSAWASSGYIYDAAGSVTIAAGKDVPRAAVVNDTVTAGMVIRTGSDSHAVLKFEDGEVVSLQSNSGFLVREYIYNPKQVVKSNICLFHAQGGDALYHRADRPQQSAGVQACDTQCNHRHTRDGVFCGSG